MVQDNGRAPAAVVLVNGVSLPGLLDIEIDANSHLSANRFCVTAALDLAGPVFSSGRSFIVEIRLGLSGAWAALIVGDVDDIEIDVGRGRLRVDGRDLTSRFIEARTQETFENQTASQIATTLAGRRGLRAVVSQTSTLVGRDYQNGRSRLTLDQHGRFTTEWDLLVRLSEGEGFDVWVEGQALYFAPPNLAGGSLTLRPSDCMSVHLHRSLLLSGGLDVSVKSWDCRGQRSVVQTVSTTAGGGGGRSYVVVKPNLTESSALQVAQRVLTEMSQHERSVTIEMPGDLTTKPRDILTLADTGTDFDGSWMVSDVSRRLSFHEGFVQRLEARLPAWTVF